MITRLSAWRNQWAVRFSTAGDFRARRTGGLAGPPPLRATSPTRVVRRRPRSASSEREETHGAYAVITQLLRRPVGLFVSRPWASSARQWRSRRTVAPSRPFLPLRALCKRGGAQVAGREGTHGRCSMITWLSVWRRPMGRVYLDRCWIQHADRWQERAFSNRWRLPHPDAPAKRAVPNRC